MTGLHVRAWSLLPVLVVLCLLTKSIFSARFVKTETIESALLQHPVIGKKSSQTLVSPVSQRGVDNLATVFSEDASHWLPKYVTGKP